MYICYYCEHEYKENIFEICSLCNDVKPKLKDDDNDVDKGGFLGSGFDYVTGDPFW